MRQAAGRNKTDQVQAVDIFAAFSSGINFRTGIHMSAPGSVPAFLQIAEWQAQRKSQNKSKPPTIEISCRWLNLIDFRELIFRSLG